MFVHGVNVIVSDVGSTRSSGNACVYYFLNILLDTTLGTSSFSLSYPVECLTRSRCLRHLYHPFLPDMVPRREAKTKRAPVRAIWLTTLPQLLGPPIGHLRHLPHFYEAHCHRRRLLLGRSIRHCRMVAKLARQRRHRPGHLVRCVCVCYNRPVSLITALRCMRSTMGLFPIFMNIIQFWVIDSIIKVGGVGGLGVQLEEQGDETDHEPLFIDDPDGDEDDDDSGEAVAKRDVEAQAQTQTRLRHSIDSTHTYPPSLPGSPTGPSTTIRYTSVSPPPISRSLPLVQRPPAPLLPHSTAVPTVNSHSLPSKASEGVGARTKEDWQAWDGEEDWPDRVGEEDGTGREAEGEVGTGEGS
jgi:hypothetical protein